LGGGSKRPNSFWGGSKTNKKGGKVHVSPRVVQNIACGKKKTKNIEWKDRPGPNARRKTGGGGLDQREGEGPERKGEQGHRD